MALTLTQVLQFIASDEAQLLGYLFELDQMKVNNRQEITDILERYIVEGLTDENGYLKPGALDVQQINELEQELLEIYSPENLDEMFAQSVDLVDARLLTIDDLMRTLELENAILGADVFEMETVNDEIDRIAQGLVRGAYGEGDYKGSVQRVRESMQSYRLNRNKSEFTLRSELMDTLEKDAGAGINHSNSVAITSMMSVDRKLRRVQADRSGTEYGMYSGPFDDLIRPFCDEWIGQVELWEFWDDLENDMPEGLFDKPASVYCGGINCRHRIVPWELSWSDGEQDLRDRFAMALRSAFQNSRFDLSKLVKYS